MTPKNHTTISLALLGALLLLVPASSFSQSLGEVARQYRKEREAREKEGKVPVRVFTNDDIQRMSPATTPDSSEQSPLPPPGPPTPEANLSGSPRPPATSSGETATQALEGQAAQPADKIKSKEYWKARFKAARAALSHAKEEQTLVEDELQLLQIQQARELDPNLSRKLNSQIDAATIQLEAKRAATETSQQALDETEKEFKESGAPTD